MQGRAGVNENNGYVAYLIAFKWSAQKTVFPGEGGEACEQHERGCRRVRTPELLEYLTLRVLNLFSGQTTNPCLLMNF